MDPTLDRWLDAIKVAMTAVTVSLAFAVAAGDPVMAGGAALGGAVVSWVVSPLSVVGRHTPFGEAVGAAGPDDVVVFWRPGCSVCIALLRGLTRDERDAMTWVNVVRDDDAARFVRDRRDGDMVTPTAVTGGGTVVTADVETLRSLLGSR